MQNALVFEFNGMKIMDACLTPQKRLLDKQAAANTSPISQSDIKKVPYPENRGKRKQLKMTRQKVDRMCVGTVAGKLGNPAKTSLCTLGCNQMRQI